jgi:predicted acyltransferase
MGSPQESRPNRVVALDAYRGLVMFLMMAEVLHFAKLSRVFPESQLWAFLAREQSHVPWAGCSLHDLIQPSFTFLVGTALPFSLASRFARGHSTARILLHAAWRAVVLVVLGVFLRSVEKPQTYFTFEDTLSQIGLGYLPLVLLAFAPRRAWLIALAVILVGYWLAFAVYPAPGPEFDYTAVGVPPDWTYNYNGFAAHWNKNSNLAWRFDTWFLNLFPREEAFRFNDGGYATLSFIPTLGTMILGLFAGDRIRRDGPTWATVGRLTIAGVVLLAIGWAVDANGVCPSVKRIWTPSWTVFSGGWCFLILAAFYSVTDLLGFRAWTFPLRVIGVNSIAAYCLDHLIEGFIFRSLHTHVGREALDNVGGPFAPLVSGVAVLAIYWLILFWMDRRRIYLRI